MSDYNESDKSQDVCQDKKCPEVTLAGKLKDIPVIPDEDLEEYLKIKDVKKQPIDDTRKSAKREAKKTRDDSLSDLELTLNTAKKVFETAQMKQKSDTCKEETRVSYKIETLYDQYIQDLLKAGIAVPSLKKCDSYADLPDYIKAVHATKFFKEIASLKIEHQTNLNTFNNTLFEATKVWELAKIAYCNAKCDAEAKKEKADLEADLTWRTSLETEVSAACKV